MYRVQWVKSALDELTVGWTNADSTLREAITSAVHELDEHLRTDPLAQGESRPEGRRVVFVSPLGITFRVDEGDRIVAVLRVWLLRRRGTS